MASFGEFRACMANFVSLWPPTTRAGRTLYRIQGGCGSSRHNRTPSAAGVEGAGGSGGHGRASRSTLPSRRLACGDLAGGRARRRPEHQRSRNQQAQPQILAEPPVWRAQEGPEGTAVPVVDGGVRLRCPWAAAEPASEKSHAIRLGEVSTKLENVAIPTI